MVGAAVWGSALLRGRQMLPSAERSPLGQGVPGVVGVTLGVGMLESRIRVIRLIRLIRLVLECDQVVPRRHPRSLEQTSTRSSLDCSEGGLTRFAHVTQE